ncbi:hypothetical protein [Actinotalea sp. Marseille-Q4924]|uniref:hypothetical protein n=1 Tax=Actinotalea sp. Marseille-Q4924 TaxID=2866571 RepID=UPI001CE40D36|nr:hypothetical protein [Actinotalea sp. Marseille-Q4924]
MKEADEPAAGATAPSPLEAGIAHNRAQLEKMREHLRTYGSAVGALATAVLAGVGWATLKDIAPVPEGREWLIVVAGVAALAALGGAVLLVGLFFAAQRRIVFDTDTIPDARTPWDATRKEAGRSNDLTHREARAARAPLDDLADEELAADVAAVEGRQYRLARTARRYAAQAATLEAGSSERARATARAEQLQAEADRLADAHRAAAVQAAVRVLETRQRQVFDGRQSRILSLVVVAGIVGLFVVADYSRGARALDAAQLACADKLVALAGAELAGYSCDARGRLVAPASLVAGDGSAADEEEPTADVGMLERLAACEDAVARPASTADRVEGWEERAAMAISLCAGLPVQAADDATAAGEPDEDDSGDG